MASMNTAARTGGGRSFGNGLRERASRFVRREDGSFPIMTAALAIPMMMGAAVALDTAELYRARANFQAATDAGVLVAAKIFADGGTEADAKAEGERTFAANLANLSRSKGTIRFTFPGDCQKGNIVAKSAGLHPLWFPGIHGVGSGENGGGARIPVQAAAQCPNTSFEVALVVDTSGSMNSRPKTGGALKIETLRDAARDLVDDLFAAGANAPKIAGPVQFSVVPFSGMVNVGADNKDAVWMDTEGLSSIHHKDLDWSWDTARGARRVGTGWQDREGKALTRFTLFDDLAVDWDGCVQARPYPHFVQDTAPDASDPDTLFVPAFAPDEPDNLTDEDEMQDGQTIQPKPWCTSWRWYWFRSRGRWYRVRGCNRWTDGSSHYFNNRADPSFAQENDGYYYINRVYQFQQARTEPPQPTGRKITGEANFINDYIADDVNMPDDNECRGLIRHEKCAGSEEKQLRRLAFTFKYDGAVVENANEWFGPNYMCSVQPLLPLSTDKEKVKTMIDGLEPNGMTNVTAGAAWGWRTLSSGAPFTEGRDETKRDNRKIMILMTDGQNTYEKPSAFGDFSDATGSEYGGYGYGRHDDGSNDRDNGDGFLFDGFDRYANPGQNAETYTQAMDDHLAKVCTNAKKEGITIYAVAFDVAAGSSIKPTLEGCASASPSDGSKHYYDAKSSAELTQAFKEIADSIKMLRLVQ